MSEAEDPLPEGEALGKVDAELQKFVSYPPVRTICWLYTLCLHDLQWMKLCAGDPCSSPANYERNIWMKPGLHSIYSTPHFSGLFTCMLVRLVVFKVKMEWNPSSIRRLIEFHFLGILLERVIFKFPDLQSDRKWRFFTLGGFPFFSSVLVS